MKCILLVVVFALCSYVVLSQTTQAPPPPPPSPPAPPAELFTCYTCKTGACLADSKEEIKKPDKIWVAEPCGSGITQCLSTYPMIDSTNAISRSCATDHVDITDNPCTTDETTKIVTCICEKPNCNDVNPHNAYSLHLDESHGTPGRSDHGAVDDNNHGGHNSAGSKDQWLVLATGLISLLLCRFLNNFRG